MRLCSGGQGLEGECLYLEGSPDACRWETEKQGFMWALITCSLCCTVCIRVLLLISTKAWCLGMDDSAWNPRWKFHNWDFELHFAEQIQSLLVVSNEADSHVGFQECFSFLFFHWKKNREKHNYKKQKKKNNKKTKSPGRRGEWSWSPSLNSGMQLCKPWGPKT